MRIVLFVVLLLALAGAGWLLMDDGGAGDRRALEDEAALLDPEARGPTLAGHGGAARPERTVKTAAGTARDTAPPEPVGDQIRVVGRVVDQRRHPVAGAEVEVVVRGGVTGRGRTDAEGRFAVIGDLPGTTAKLWNGCMVLARHGDTAGQVSVNVWGANPGDEVEAAPIVLLAGQRLDVRVLYRQGAVASAPVMVVAGAGLVLFEGTSGALGLASVPVLPPGAYVVVARGTQEGQGRGAARVGIPRASPSEPLEVDIGDERTLQVWVKDKVSGAPIAGARIVVGDEFTPMPVQGPGYLPPLPPAVTDAEGLAVVRGLGEGKPLVLGAAAQGYAQPSGWGNINMLGIDATARTATLEMHPYKTVRFPIQEGEVPAPGPGEAVTATYAKNAWVGGPGDIPLVATVERDAVVIEGLNPVYANGTVETQDGRIAVFYAQQGQETGSQLTFYRSRPLVVRVVDGAGKALQGIHLIPVNAQGNQPLDATASTDVEGLVTWDKLAADRVTIKRVEGANGNWWNAPALETIKLAEIEGIHEIRLVEGPPLVLAVRLAGVAALPAAYTLLVDGRAIETNAIEEDAVAARLRFRLPKPPDEGAVVKLTLQAAGHLPGTVEIPPGAATSDSVHTVDLVACAAIVAHVVAPEDGNMNLQLQRHDAAKDAWEGYNPPGRGPVAPQAPSAASGVQMQRYDGLEAGRFRVYDGLTRQASEAVDVYLGMGDAEVRLDLSSATWVSGTIVGPDDVNLRTAQVRVADDRGVVAPEAWGGTGVDERGNFRVRALRGESVVLEAWHPLLAPALQGGRVVARGGADGVRLRLERAGGVAFVIPALEANQGKDPRRNRSFRGNQVLVEAFPATGGESAVKQVYAMAEDGVYRIGGLRAGRYTLRIVVDGWAPYERVGVQIGEQADTDLGVVQLDRGTVVRVHILGHANADETLTAWANAQRLGERSYWRNGGGQVKPGEPIEVQGLGPGRWKVMIYAQSGAMMWSGGPPLLEKEIEVDGTTPIDLEIRKP